MEANSPAARYSRKRRQHVMEGSFADAVNHHGAKQARWRGVWRQKIQSWLIAAVQNLRILLRHQVTGPVRPAAGAPGGGAGRGRVCDRKIRSCLIGAVQNLGFLLPRKVTGRASPAAVARGGAADGGLI